MSFLEKDIEDIIFEAIQTQEGGHILAERGLSIDAGIMCPYFRSKRQLEIGNYGICDIITISKENSLFVRNRLYQPLLHIEIIEIKKGEVNLDTMLQVCRYAKGVERYMKAFHPRLKFSISTTMIGRSVNALEWIFLFERDKRSRILTYEYNMDGIQFNEQSGFFKAGENWGRKKKSR